MIDIMLPALHRTILHWFTGTAEQIERAAAAGAYLSINAAMTDDHLVHFPPDRVLPATDYPFTRRAGSAQPGDIARLEQRVGRLWSKAHDEVRRAWYLNLRGLSRQAEVLDRLPDAIIAPIIPA